MEDGPQKSKWEQYYAADPSKTPWDTHTVSSQLRKYLCKCLSASFNAAASTAAAAAATTGFFTAAATPALASLTQTGARDATTTSRNDTVRNKSDDDEGLRRSGDRIGNFVGHDAATHNLSDGKSQKVEDLEMIMYGNTKPSDDRNNESTTGNETLGSAAATALTLHVCDRCAYLKPAANLDTLDGHRRLRRRRVWALELCCGTGGSLAFMHRLGFSVAGVDLVAAACHMAAKRLAAVASSPVAVQTVETVADVLRLWAGDPEPPGAGPRACQDLIGHSPVALVAAGNLFLAAWPRGFFDFVYDCQGLHAMPLVLRPAYVAVLSEALRSGGLALLLVGRVEDDLDFDFDLDSPPLNGNEKADATLVTPRSKVVKSMEVQYGGRETGDVDCDEMSRGSHGGYDGDPRVNGSCNSLGPSLMSLGELRGLFGADDWEWCWCKPTRFDSTPLYDKLPRPPPAWCLLLRRL
ncbi:hypothetical protein VaNZ11_007921 [Volvox africanus]|uniref:Methyltransferase type 11 domain-containing protein n=1 Tax=Volvox africanus TaxID=51714 RepID=A0ABQ5S5K2_9CHLO|nr:hypothetical protein VaNZ11_007921 [Volvox africanus]